MKKLLLFIVMFLILFSVSMASGTGAGTVITAISTNVVLSYDDGQNQFYSTAASFNIDDVTKDIDEIHGLYENSVDVSSLGTPVGGVYKNLAVGTDYGLIFSYLNRGNLNDDVQISAALTQAASRWTVTNSATITVNEDQIGSLYVTVNPLNANNWERVTLDITANIVDYGSKNVVSYNVLPQVVSSDMQNYGYGGLGFFAHQYVLEAEGVSLSILSKTVSWNYPADYTGTTTKPVPGSLMTYTVVIQNNSTGMATSINLADRVPQNCHLYYNGTATPNIVGAASWVWQGSTTNTADSTVADAIKFSINISGNTTVTADYSVTVD